MAVNRPLPSRRSRLFAAALLVAAIAAGTGIVLTRETPPAFHPARDDGAPPLLPVGENRYRGPDGLTVRAPDSWRMDSGSSENLWGTLRPRDSVSKLPQVGVGSISTNGLAGGDAVDTLDEILNEILPELSSQTFDEGDYRVTTGTGTIGGREVIQVRLMRVIGERVAVAWGIFESPTAGADDLVREVAESFADK